MNWWDVLLHAVIFSPVAITFLLLLGALGVFEKIKEWLIMMKPKKWRTDQDGVFDFNYRYSCANVRNTTCCGTCELHDLADGPLASLAILAAWQEGLIKNFSDEGNVIYRGNFKPIVLFTDRTTFRNGTSLADYIRRHRLGEVVTTTPVRNPNSGAKVQGWLWRINRQRWNTWVRKHVVFETPRP